MAQIKGIQVGANIGNSAKIATTAQNAASIMANAGKNVTNTLGAYSGAAASKANAISAQAQTAQGLFNQGSVDNANAITQANFEKTMEYNATEAQKNRDWQEHMASTAYQRTVADMIKAGINPIMASQLGATSSGSGATASTSAPSGQAASEGNYTGQMENMSSTLALIGAIASSFSQAMSGLSALKDINITLNSHEKTDISKWLEGLLYGRDKNGNINSHNLGTFFWNNYIKNPFWK